MYPAFAMQSAKPTRWPNDVPVRLSETLLKPILLHLLDPANVVNEIEAKARSHWPNTMQVNHYLFDCRGASREETSTMCEIVRQVIAAAKQETDIRSRWDFLAACGFALHMGVYEDPGMSCLSLQIVRNPEAEARIRASLPTGSNGVLARPMSAKKLSLPAQTPHPADGEAVDRCS